MVPFRGPICFLKCQIDLVPRGWVCGQGKGQLWACRLRRAGPMRAKWQCHPSPRNSAPGHKGGRGSGTLVNGYQVSPSTCTWFPCKCWLIFCLLFASEMKVKQWRRDVNSLFAEFKGGFQILEEYLLSYFVLFATWCLQTRYILKFSLLSIILVASSINTVSLS